MDQHQPKIIKVCSVDPGINLGLACLEVNVDAKTIKVIEAETLVIDDIAKYHYPEILETQGVLLTRTFIINKYVGKYCEKHDVDFVVHETAFSSHGRVRFGNAVESFAKLRENILAIKLAAMNYCSRIPIVPVNPMTVKMVVCGHQSSDKDQVSKSLLAKEDLEIDFDPKYLDEHGWDAMAIGYSFIKKRLLGVPKYEHSKRDKRPKGNKTKRA